MTALSEYDQETLNNLAAVGVSSAVIARVRTSLEEAQELQDALNEPQVAWVIPLEYARLVVDHLHRTMPGGYQEHHDDLRRAIRQAATP